MMRRTREDEQSRALCNRSQPPPFTTNAVEYFQSSTGATVTAFTSTSNLTCGFCLLSSRNFDGFDVLRISHVLYWVCFDAAAAPVRGIQMGRDDV
ncbi:hypothetical protein MTR_2g038645 [Medicago truncatula]|uniref:Uncharacterized protein n=1 Tax=Medicago truncatula TaxID=3880 RepID=A0A072V6M3_MEDTR|nr:hypothetical protein MTR_2g038645 [Medicago truncatula]